MITRNYIHSLEILCKKQQTQIEVLQSQNAKLEQVVESQQKKFVGFQYQISCLKKEKDTFRQSFYDKLVPLEKLLEDASFRIKNGFDRNYQQLVQELESDLEKLKSKNDALKASIVFIEQEQHRIIQDTVKTQNSSVEMASDLVELTSKMQKLEIPNILESRLRQLTEELFQAKELAQTREKECNLLKLQIQLLEGDIKLMIK